MKKGFARRLSALRRDAGLTQRDVASATDVLKDSTSAYEAGVRQPTADNLYRLAKHFNVSMDWLWSGRERKEYQNPMADLATGKTTAKSEKAKMAAEIAAMAFDMSPKNAKILRVLAKELS